MTIFDNVVNRKHTSCTKWDYQGGDYIPMWVADMDFKCPQAIIDAVEKRLNHGVFGYTKIDEELTECVVNYYKTRYGYILNPEWIVFIPGVMPGANMACRVAGGDMMINIPMYPHIRRLPQEARVKAVEVDLKIENGKYTFDFNAMENCITPGLKEFILCNPHNPVGRVYTKEELEKVASFCTKHDLLVISDEIHSELILEGKHIPYFMVNEEAKNHSIVLTSAGKTYNMPSLPFGFAIIPNEDIRNKYKDSWLGLIPSPNALTLEAFKTAYNNCGEWKSKLIDYLIANRDYMEERIAKIDGLKVNHNEATFLAWIDARDTGLDDPFTFFKEKAGVRFNDGKDFGKAGFVRLNYGCPRSQLKEAIDRIEKALKQ